MRSRILSMLFFISVLVGQPSFTEHSLGNSEYHTSMVSADMDNDGDLDLLATQYIIGNSVVYYKND